MKGVCEVRCKLLGFKDREFEAGINDWLAENPTIEIKHATAFPLAAEWWQILLFYNERPAWDSLGRSLDSEQHAAKT